MMRISAWALAAVAAGSAVAVPAQLTPTRLLCEYRVAPAGLDVARPRLGWTLVSTGRAERQTAYQVRVAGSAAALAAGRADLWDSGRVASSADPVEYAGKPLGSRRECWWQVRVWDAAGRPSAWSRPAHWSMGLLKPADWKALWISDATLASPENRPRTPIHCYRSQLADRPDRTKWIVLDLGRSCEIDGIALGAARPAGLNADLRTSLFPRRFRVLVSDAPDFAGAAVAVDETHADYPEPRGDECAWRLEHAVRGRYVKLEVTRLGYWDGRDYGVALAYFKVLKGAENLAAQATPSCSDSVENERWSARFLTAGRTQVAFAPLADAVRTEVNGASCGSRVPLLRKAFTLPGRVRRATLHVTARGFYEMRLNGRRVGDELLSPGFTDYARRISVQSFDVTPLLRPGANTLGALLGYGWYAGHMNISDNGYLYGFFPQILAQLDVDLADGRRMTVGTDSTWKTTLDGAVRWSDLLEGEAVDLRRAQAGWDRPGFDASGWRPAWQQPRDATVLDWQRCQPVRAIKLIRPRSVKQVSPGVYVYDLGQEITGWCRLKVDGPVGAVVTLRHAEAVKPDGNIDVSSLWGIGQREDYVLDGRGARTLEPHFTYHGFRYVELKGLAQAPRPDTLTAVNLHSHLRDTGAFACSNPLFNRLMEASKWTQRNLFFDVPAGCAARAERLAWTGDVRPCAPTALFNFDSAPLFAKYLVDLRDDQKPAGAFTDICPHAHLAGTPICVGSPGWTEAGVTLPWDLYMQTGDRRAVAEHYAAARRYVEWIHGNNPDLLWRRQRGQNWGDWLSAGKPTPNDLGSSAFFAHDLDLLARMAAMLGKTEDARRYRALFADARRAFTAAYVHGDGRLGVAADGSDETQGSYALALHFGLLAPPVRERAAERLAELVRANGYHPTTGFWSSVELLLALSESGHHAEASRMAASTDRPSWGNMLTSGGTTFWEAFDADTRTLSLNHWTHSAIGEWLWREVAGLNPDPDRPGYARFLVRPRPTEQVSWCRATCDTVRGPIAVSWRSEAGALTLDLTVPAGSEAIVELPRVGGVTESGRKLPAGMLLRRAGGVSTLTVPSGAYHFRAALAAR